MVEQTEHILQATEIVREFTTDEGESVVALKDFDLTVTSGEIVSLVGPSGCGKSTFLRLVSGLDSVTEGTLTYDGSPITDVSPFCGFMFQHDNLFPWLNVWDNVAFPLVSQKRYKTEKNRVRETIDMVGLQGFEKSYPHQISGGMASRVAIAQTFITNPSVILLDEPLSALDAFTRSKIQDEILRIWREYKPMILLVTHDIEEAVYMSTRVVVLSHRPGRVIGDIAIDLPFPRDRISLDFIRYRGQIMELLGRELEIAEEEARKAELEA